MMRQDFNRRQACWAQYLSRFNLKWLHKAGVTMGKVNALSRCEDHMIGMEDDNKGVHTSYSTRICQTKPSSDLQ